MKRSIFLILIFLCLKAQAQELTCNVQINSDKIEGSNKQQFNTLQQSITDFMNNTKFTNLSYAANERIDCTLMLIVNSIEDGIFRCDMQLQVRRPVFGTSYSTPLLNYRDTHFSFAYQEYDRIELTDASFTSNLAALLTYYAYLILGLDADSFSPLGGNPFYQQSENVMNLAQTASIDDAELKGWKSFDSNKNRYALLSNLQDDAFRKFRQFFYTYHRLGLDAMSQNVANGRARIAQDINILQEANKARPGTYIVPVFMDAKSDELVQIFKQGTSEEKKKVYDVLMAIDPTRSNAYDALQ
ncbi:MAG: DUF4835 family protein [Paludibacteraceae bacterium]|nr:DUF4835 family protein [Paludibacteraceae bacterium]